MKTSDRYTKLRLDSDKEAEEALKRNNARTLERLQKELEADKKVNGKESKTIGELEDELKTKDIKEETRGKSRKKKDKKENKVIKSEEPRNNGKYMRTRDWLLLILMANVPLIGWIPLVYGMFARKSTPDKVKFCKAMLLYQIILTFISFCILYVSIQLVAIIFEYFLENIVGIGLEDVTNMIGSRLGG